MFFSTFSTISSEDTSVCIDAANFVDEYLNCSKNLTFAITTYMTGEHPNNGDSNEDFYFPDEVFSALVEVPPGDYTTDYICK